MLYFRVFVDIHSSRSLDSFPGLTPFPCLQFANSFDCHTSENSLVSPAIATDPKTHVSNPFICHTSQPPGGPPISIQHTCQVFILLPTPSSAAHATISPYALSPSFSHSCALFCAFLHSTKTQLFCFQSIPHSLPRTAGGGVCLSNLQPPPRPLFHVARNAGQGSRSLPVFPLSLQLSTVNLLCVARPRVAEHESPVTAIHGAAVLSFGRNLKLITYD